YLLLTLVPVRLRSKYLDDTKAGEALTLSNDIQPAAISSRTSARINLAGRAATKTWNISRKGAKSAKKNESLIRWLFCRVMLNAVKHLLLRFPNSFDQKGCSQGDSSSLRFSE